MRAPPETVAEIINLLTNRKEEGNVRLTPPWVADPVVKIIGELEARKQLIEQF